MKVQAKLSAWLTLGHEEWFADEETMRDHYSRLLCAFLIFNHRWPPFTD